MNSRQHPIVVGIFAGSFLLIGGLDDALSRGFSGSGLSQDAGGFLRGGPGLFPRSGPTSSGRFSSGAGFQSNVYAQRSTQRPQRRPGASGNPGGRSSNRQQQPIQQNRQQQQQLQRDREQQQQMQQNRQQQQQQLQQNGQQQQRQQKREQQQKQMPQSRTQQPQDRRQTHAQNVASRQQGHANPSRLRQNTIQKRPVHGGYYSPSGGDYHNNGADWDDGEVAAPAIAAAALKAVGVYAAEESNSSQSSSGSAASSTGLPCTQTTVFCNGMIYTQDDANSYTQTDAVTGVIYLLVAPPRGS